MTKITIDDARHVAQLSRLGLNDEQLAQMAGELDTIIESISKISELELDDIPPTTHAIPIANVFGEDEPHESLSREQVFKNAPAADSDCFLVPRMS